MKEIWKDIKGYEGYYQISNKGKIKGKDRIIKSKNNKFRTWKGINKILQISRQGYYVVNLYKNGKYKNLKVHRLVLISFVNNPYKYNNINHKDGNKLNNNINNLEWCNMRQNFDHAKVNNLTCYGEKQHFHKLSSQKVLDVRRYHEEMILNIKELAEMFNVHIATIYQILNKKTWIRVY